MEIRSRLETSMKLVDFDSRKMRFPYSNNSWLQVSISSQELYLSDDSFDRNCITTTRTSISGENPQEQEIVLQQFRPDLIPQVLGSRFFLIGCHGSVVYVFCRLVAAVFLLTLHRSWRSGAGKKFHAVKSYKNTWFCATIRLIQSKACKPGLLRKKKRQFRFVAWCPFTWHLFAQGESLASDSCVLTILRDVILFRGLLEGVVLFYQLCEVLENLFHPPMLAPWGAFFHCNRVCEQDKSASSWAFSSFVFIRFLLIKDTTWKNKYTHLWRSLKIRGWYHPASHSCGHSFVPATVIARKTIKKRPVTSKLSQQWAFGCLETCWNWQSKKRKNVWRIACRILTACCRVCQNPAVFCISGCPQCLAGHSSCACSKRFRSLKWWFPCVSWRNSEPPFLGTCKVGSRGSFRPWWSQVSRFPECPKSPLSRTCLTTFRSWTTKVRLSRCRTWCHVNPFHVSNISGIDVRLLISIWAFLWSFLESNQSKSQLNHRIELKLTMAYPPFESW